MSKRDDELFDEINSAVGRRYSGKSDDTGEERIKSTKADRIRRERLKKQELKEKKRKKRKRILISIPLIIILFGLFLAFTKPGNKLVLRMASIYASKLVKSDDSVKAEAFQKHENVPAGWAYDENVVNILLVGIENIGGAPHTDSMIVMSENLKTGKITLVSFLRDTYVEIYGMNKWQKLNYAFFAGGMDTLINTLQNTYKFYIDAYAYVNFDSFQKIIDELGGVDIELTEKEAEYLNTTNYVSDKANHNLKAGFNHMNGNQALGYCRVRMIATLEGDNNDLGRSLRQRKVLSALFAAYKDQNVFKMISTSNSLLKSLTTNMSSGNIYTLLEGYYDSKKNQPEQLMIPTLETLDAINIQGVGSVLSIENHKQQNIDLLHNALYGKEEG